MFKDPCSRWLDYEDNHSCFFIGGIIAGIGGIAGGAISAAGSTQAANIAARAQQNALNFQQGIYNTSQGQLAPYYGAGTNALSNITGNIGTPTAPGVLTETPQAFAGLPQNVPNFSIADFQSSPGYQFQLGQGINAIQNAAGPKTGVLSGNTLQAIQQYGTGLANQDWWNWLNNQQNLYTQDYNMASQNQGNLWNRFLQLALGGQQAATLTGPQAGLVSNIANTTAGIGQTQAAGTLGQYGGIANSVNSLANAFNQGGGANLSNNYNLAYALNSAPNTGSGNVTGYSSVPF